MFELAQVDWPRAFSDLTVEEFSWYLRELETFGVLRHADDGWVLRSPNLIGLLGSGAEIEQRLARIADNDPAERLNPTRLRFPIDAEGTPGPLAGDQVQRLSPDGTALTVIVASELSGAGAVKLSLERLKVDRQFELSYRNPKTPADMPHRLNPTGHTGAWGIEVADLTGLDCETGRRLASVAISEILAAPRRSASQLIVVRPDQMAELKLGDALVSPLRNWDRLTLRTWFEATNVAVSDRDIDDIISMTGGWYSLLQPGFAASPESSSQFRAALAAPGWDLVELCRQAGLGGVEHAPFILNELAFSVAWSAGELDELFSDRRPDVTLPALRRAGLIVPDGPGWILEPMTAGVARGDRLG